MEMIKDNEKPKKNRLIKDLQKDEMVNDIFVVKFKKPVEQYKNGFKFELRLGDSSREIMYKYWGSNNEEKVKNLYDSIKVDDVVFVQGRVNEWNGNLEISGNEDFALEVIPIGNYNPDDFLKKTKRDIEKMFNELMSLIDSIEDEELRKILDYFFKDESFAKKFKTHPAAMYIHHGWIGGLLEHTLEVSKIVDFVCKELHKNLDRDLALSGAILHDIGKLEEFNVTTNIKVSTKGMLIGHTVIGFDLLKKTMDKLNISENLQLKLLHMVLTHMGEYGSTKTPSFPEAQLVHLADQLDGSIVEMISLKEDANTEDDYIYSRRMQKNIYLK